MGKTFHEYDFPHDATVHWYGMGEELREDATTTQIAEKVTCAGCRAWLKTIGHGGTDPEKKGSTP